MRTPRLKQELDVLARTGGELADGFAEDQEVYQGALEARRKARGEDDASAEVPPVIVRMASDTEEEDEEDIPPPQVPESIVSFYSRYQRWYTCALPLVKEAAPDRYAEFQSYYEQPNRYGPARTYTMQDFFNDYSPVLYECQPWVEALRCFVSQIYIITAARDRLEWRAVMDAPDHMQREVELAELETARCLIPMSQHAAAAMAGTIFQHFVQALAKKHKLTFRKLSPPPREVVNRLKEAKVLEADVANQCTWLAGIHERCLREGGELPTRDQVGDLINGTQWLLTNVF